MVIKKTNIKQEIKPVKRLYRSEEDKIIGGVCGGIAQYFNIDPVWVRLIAILLVFLEGFGILAYIVLWILVPQNPNQKDKTKKNIDEKINKNSEKISNDIKKSNNEENSSNHIYVGVILIIIGLLFLLKNTLWWFNSQIFWGILIIAIGSILIFKKR